MGLVLTSSPPSVGCRWLWWNLLSRPNQQSKPPLDYTQLPILIPQFSGQNIQQHDAKIDLG